MRRVIAAALVSFAAVVACADATPAGYLSALDTTPPEGVVFDPNSLLSIEELTDTSIGASQLRAFLSHRAVEKTIRNPYGYDSFLASYYSNGNSAVDALLNAASEHRINPLVLLVRAQMAQGLVSLGRYPHEAANRVEFVFGCGCAGPNACDIAQGGFDRQVACLARQYRIIVDEMERNQSVTSGGWAKGREGRTVDQVVVVPDGEGTAALYQFEPLVGRADSGNRLFWTIWKLYARAAGYQSPAPGSGTGRWIGAACAGSQCASISNGLCVAYPDGMCSARCNAQTVCPVREGAQVTGCVEVAGEGFCFAECEVGVDSSCRAGSPDWACCAVKTLVPGGETKERPLCIPSKPGAPRTCPAG